MAEYITKIKTAQGDKQIDYNALANQPLSSLGVMDKNLLITTEEDSALALIISEDGNPNDEDDARAKVHKSADGEKDYGLQLRDYARYGRKTNTSSVLVICDDQTNVEDKLQFVVQENGVNTYYKIYGEHYEPTNQENPTQSQFEFLRVSRFGQAKRLRIMNAKVAMTAGSEYAICTLSDKYRPASITYASYVCINANSSGAKYGLIKIDASNNGRVTFTPYSDLSAGEMIIIDISYV